MSQVTFSIPDEILLALKATPDVVASRIRLAAAVKLYAMGELSSGAAAQLAGVPRPYFSAIQRPIQYLHQIGYLYCI
jgi:predicted HTH domain antitoxin